MTVLCRQGLCIAYLEHAYRSFDLDRPSKDSYGLRAAGAAQICRDLITEPVHSIPQALYFDEAPPAVAVALAARRVAILRGRGVYACGTDLDLAYRRACALELSAKTAILARLARLPAPEQEGLR